MTFYLKHMKSNKHTYIQFIIILKFIKYHFQRNCRNSACISFFRCRKKTPRFEIDLLHILLKRQFQTQSFTVFTLPKI